MQLAKYTSVVLASMLKFIGGPLSGVALGLPWLTTVLCTVLGMMLSVVIILFAGVALEGLLHRYRPRRVKRRFTSRTRLAVRIWQRTGLTGIALLTPLLLTPIGGTILAISFKASRWRILLYMLSSALFWGFTITRALYLLPDFRVLFRH